MEQKETNKRWRAPHRAWELVLLASFFFVIALAGPGVLKQRAPPVEKKVALIHQAKPAGEAHNVLAVFINRQEIPWLIVIGGLFAAYLFSPNPFISRVTISFFDLLAPLLFSVLAWARLARAIGQGGMKIYSLQGRALDAFLWLAATLALMAGAIALNRLRQQFKWRGVHWDIETPTIRDASFRRLLMNLYPLFYMPRAYQICPEGLRICGLHYFMAIPFSAIEAARMEKKARTEMLLAESAYLAASTKIMIRLSIKGLHKPVYISPKKHSAFFMYIRIARSQRRKAA